MADYFIFSKGKIFVTMPGNPEAVKKERLINFTTQK